MIRAGFATPKRPTQQAIRAHASRNSPARIARFLVETQAQRLVFLKRPGEYGAWLRERLTDMGPAFIKLGQFVSTRTDLLDKRVIAELSRLQDDITPIPGDQVRAGIEESLSRPINELFSHFEDQPIACASIGQVHLATLRANGAQVVVKVQKPGVAQSIRDDIATLLRLNELQKGWNSHRYQDMNSILSQYERFLSAELDYRKELQHMVRFYDLFEGQSILIPRVYPQYSTRDVLTMEYVPSTKITDIDLLRQKGFSTEGLADQLIDAFLQMIIYHGLVHCDPHPGNIGVVVGPDGTASSLVLYDFGNVLELSDRFRLQLNELVFSIFQRDADEFVDILLGLGVLKAEGEEELLQLQEFFGSFFVYLETMDFGRLQQSVAGGKEPVGSFDIDPDFLGLFRVFSLLDGTCSRLDPGFNYIEALGPFLQDIVQDTRFFDTRARKDLLKLTTYPRKIADTDRNLVKVQKKITELNGKLQSQNTLFGVLLLSLIVVELPCPWNLAMAALAAALSLRFRQP